MNRGGTDRGSEISPQRTRARARNCAQQLGTGRRRPAAHRTWEPPRCVEPYHPAGARCVATWRDGAGAAARGVVRRARCGGRDRGEPVGIAVRVSTALWSRALRSCHDCRSDWHPHGRGNACRLAASAARIADRPDARAQGVVRAVGRRPVHHRSDRRNPSEVCTAHRFVGRPISASGPASPKLIGERRGDQGVARGVPPSWNLPCRSGWPIPKSVLHRFRAVTPAGPVVSERRIRAAPSAAR